MLGPATHPRDEPGGDAGAPGAREVLAQQLDSVLDPETLKVLIDEILAVKKSMWAEFKCKSCGQRQRIHGEVSDARAVASALSELLTQARGRPGQADDGVAERERVVFTRQVIYEGAPE